MPPLKANHDRGMPHFGVKRSKLESQLARWIDLSMNNAVPASLLILSRSFVITTTDHDTAETGEALKMAIKSIEKEVVEEIAEELEVWVPHAVTTTLNHIPQPLWCELSACTRSWSCVYDLAGFVAGIYTYTYI